MHLRHLRINLLPAISPPLAASATCGRTPGWFGGELSPAAESRLGDVVLAASEPVAFLDPADVAEARMISRHGSLTPAEMWVPLLVART